MNQSPPVEPKWKAGQSVLKSVSVGTNSSSLCLFGGCCFSNGSSLSPIVSVHCSRGSQFPQQISPFHRATITTGAHVICVTTSIQSKASDSGQSNWFTDSVNFGPFRLLGRPRHDVWPPIFFTLMTTRDSKRRCISFRITFEDSKVHGHFVTRTLLWSSDGLHLAIIALALFYNARLLLPTPILPPNHINLSLSILFTTHRIQ